MPITVGALKKDKRSTPVTYGSEEVSLHYKPSAWTPETEDALVERIDSGDETANTPMLENFCALVYDWDVQNDDGTPYEISVENLRKLPSAFITTCTRAIMEDMMPGEARRSSGAGSRRRG